jgi:ribosomal protein S8
LINITGYRPTHVFSKNKKAKFVKFICETCAKKLYSLHSQELREKFIEEWKYRPLNRKLDKISLKMKKFAEKKDTLRIKEKISKQDDKIKTAKRHIRESFNKRIKKLDKQLRKVKRNLKSI